MSPHMCLLLAGIRLFRGIRQPRWFLICKQTKAEANSYFSFCLTIFSGPKHFLSHCTFNMASGEFRPKVDMMIWKEIIKRYNIENTTGITLLLFFVLIRFVNIWHFSWDEQEQDWSSFMLCVWGRLKHSCKNKEAK